MSSDDDNWELEGTHFPIRDKAHSKYVLEGPTPPCSPQQYRQTHISTLGIVTGVCGVGHPWARPFFTSL